MDGGSGLAATADIEATGRAADADEHGWTRVLAGLGNAVVASFERHPTGTAAPTPDLNDAATEPAVESSPTPALASVEQPAPSRAPAPAAFPVSRAIEAPAQSKVPMVVGALVVLIVLRWILKRSK